MTGRSRVGRGRKRSNDMVAGVLFARRLRGEGIRERARLSRDYMRERSRESKSS